MNLAEDRIQFIQDHMDTAPRAGMDSDTKARWHAAYQDAVNGLQEFAGDTPTPVERVDDALNAFVTYMSLRDARDMIALGASEAEISEYLQGPFQAIVSTWYHEQRTRILHAFDNKEPNK